MAQKVSWKETTINLKANQEIQLFTQAAANSFLVWNNDDSNYIYIGLDKANVGSYEAMIAPKNWGIISRPFEMRKLNLYSTSNINGVRVVELFSESPLSLLTTMVQQLSESTVNVNGTVGLKASELSLEAVTKYLNIAVKKNVAPEGMIYKKVVATTAGDITVKATGGKVAKIAVEGETAVYLKDGSEQAWKAGDFDGGGNSIKCSTSIVLNFAAAGTAWILYE